MPHSGNALRSLPNCREGFGENLVEYFLFSPSALFLVLNALEGLSNSFFELRRLSFQFIIGKLLDRRLKRIDLFNDRPGLLQKNIRARTKDLFNYLICKTIKS